MSASFIAVAFLVAVLLVNWRLLLLVVTACMVALMIFGLGILSPEQTAGATPGVSPAQVQSGGQAVGQPQPR